MQQYLFIALTRHDWGTHSNGQFVSSAGSSHLAVRSQRQIWRNCLLTSTYFTRQFSAVPVILQFLDVGSSYDCIGAACGVVINMTLEENLALSLIEHDIYDRYKYNNYAINYAMWSLTVPHWFRLIGMLAAVNNWAIKGLVCQICWNLASNEATKRPLREEEIFELTRLCLTFADESSKPTDEEELRNWDEDFCAVAIPLLELLANCIS